MYKTEATTLQRGGGRQLSESRFYQSLESDPTDLNNLKINIFINSLTNKGEIHKSLERKLLTTEARTPELYLNPTDLNNLKINIFINSLTNKGEIHKSLECKLLTTEARTPELYLLPKIHKNKTPVPGRPIVSANGCPTGKISALVDIFLRPHLPKTRSYLKDTTDFIQALNDLPILSKDAILCTLDVTSLYTNIPNLDGKQAAARFLIKHRQYGTGPEPSNTSLCRMLDMVLTMNNFRFDGNHYLQTAGTAMGTRVAPTYANIFMSDFEERHVYTY